MLNAGDASPDPARGVVAERLELKAGAGLVDPSHSGPKKTPSEMPQLPGPLPDGGEGVGDVQEDQAADPGDSRAPAQDSPSSKDGAAAENGAEARSASTNRFEMALREARPELLAENKPEQGSNAAAEAKTREGSAGALRSSVFDQIVQRAIVQVKNASGEIRIDLKPDFLGQVRMEIVTENQQVTVRILTERPVVRDMIETNLHQLKSELQSQGLQVQRVEVAVSNDPREQPYRQAKQGGTRKRVDAVDAAAASDRPSPVKPGEAPYYRSRAGLQATVDTFV